MEEHEQSQQKSQQISQKQQNIQNNANTMKNAADVAIASKNPYAMAAGGAVKVADKISGGRATQQLGKKMNTLNKISPGGRKIQRMSNMLAKTGAGNAIGRAAMMKNGVAGSATGGGEGKADANVENQKSEMDKDMFDKEKEEQQREKRTGQFIARLPLKAKLVIFLGIVPAFCLILIFLMLVINYSGDEKAFGIYAGGQAGDKDLKAFRAELFKHRDEFGMGSDDLGMAYVGSNTENEFNSRYENIESVYEYFDCGTMEECLQLDEVKFLIKVNDISERYKNKYGVKLDWKLLLSTMLSLDLEVKDLYSKGLNDYNEDDVEKYDKLINLDWDYDYKNIPGYQYLDSDNYQYDMQILAKNMVQKTTTQTCSKTTIDSEGNTVVKITKQQVDYDIEDKYLKKGEEYYLECDAGETYDIDSIYSLNLEKYDTFLLEYIEHKFYIKGSGNSPTSGASSYRCTLEQFNTYDLTEEQLIAIASQAYHEQGTAKGAAAEASLMANRFELYGSSYGEGSDGLYDYVRNSGWFADSKKNMDGADAPKDVVEAVRSVLIDGKRTLPSYIDEHDSLDDLKSVKTNGKSVDKSDYSEYEQYNTIIKNKYGVTYTFYTFSDTNSDPFGYTSEEAKNELGDFHYDFDSGQPVNCSSDGEYLFPLPEGATTCRSSAYGPRIHPISGKFQNHSGDDYPAAGGTPVYAVADGVVTSVGTGCTIGDYNCHGGMGNNVIIDHENGIQSVYMHATDVYVKIGDKVNKGDVIMTVGTTGSSTGNHLHITFKKDGVKDDPANYIGSLPMCY